MTNYKRGDVVLIRFPNSDLSTYKKRPALIVQADDLDTGLPQVIVALITSNLSRSGHKSRVTVAATSDECVWAGLRSDPVIVTDNLATVKNLFIDKVIGTLVDMTNVDTAIAYTFGLRLA